MNTAPIAFRIPTSLRKQATARSKELGIPLSFIVKNALTDFIHGKKLVFSNAPVEVLELSPELQKQANAVATLMEKVILKQKQKPKKVASRTIN